MQQWRFLFRGTSIRHDWREKSSILFVLVSWSVVHMINGRVNKPRVYLKENHALCLWIFEEACDFMCLPWLTSFLVSLRWWTCGLIRKPRRRARHAPLFMFTTRQQCFSSGREVVFKDIIRKNPMLNLEDRLKLSGLCTVQVSLDTCFLGYIRFPDYCISWCWPKSPSFPSKLLCCQDRFQWMLKDDKIN